MIGNCVMSNIKVIAEIGINHKGSSKLARDLINAASDAGAWGVKFQYRRKEGFYTNVTEIGDEMISAEMERAYLSPTAISVLRDYAANSGLRVGISFFSGLDCGDFGDELRKFDFYKVPSAELLNDDLINTLNALQKLVLVSTGGHGEKQIFGQIAKYAQWQNVVFMHCVSNYPILLGNQQLGFISRMKDVSSNPVGYSSHDQDWEANIIAMTLGVEYIERHLTFDKTGDGLDDSTSSVPEEFTSLCKIAARYGDIVATGARVVNQGERINIQNLGSSMYATRNLSKGEVATIDDFEIRAPRKGLIPSQFNSLLSRELSLDLSAGEPLLASHFGGTVSPIPPKQVEFCDTNDISIPLRLHDAKKLQYLFPIRNFELHLSYGEVQKYMDSRRLFLDSLDLTRTYSIHLPDYLKGNRLIDPLSDNDAIRTDSVDLISACVRLAKELEDSSGRSVPMVGSFSRIMPQGKDATYGELARFIDGIRTRDRIAILPQWLPKIAWYFGGADELDMFCGEEDIDYTIEHELELCLDVSHLILSANYAGQDWRNWYRRLIEMSRHIHLADACGIDGEGVEFGSGDLAGVGAILSVPQRVVLEVWQGHLSDGEGFRKAISYLGESSE
jgi:N-acetylneuraminate synthase